MEMLEIILTVFGAGFLSISLTVFGLLILDEKNMWIFKKRNALRALVTSDLENTDSKPLMEHLLKYYKPHKITPKIIEYFEKQYPKVLEKEQEKRNARKKKEQSFEDLYQKFEEVQTLTTGSLKEVQELGVNRNTIQKEESWKLT